MWVKSKKETHEKNLYETSVHLRWVWSEFQLLNSIEKKKQHAYAYAFQKLFAIVVIIQSPLNFDSFIALSQIRLSKMSNGEIYFFIALYILKTCFSDWLSCLKRNCSITYWFIGIGKVTSWYLYFIYDYRFVHNRFRLLLRTNTLYQWNNFRNSCDQYDIDFVGVLKYL